MYQCTILLSFDLSPTLHVYWAKVNSLLSFLDPIKSSKVSVRLSVHLSSTSLSRATLSALRNIQMKYML